MTLTINQISVSYGRTSILNQIGFSIPLGQVVGLVGENGAGKTTLMRAISDELTPSSGTVQIDGVSTLEQPALKPSVIYLDPARLFFSRYQLSRVMDFYAQAYPTFDSAQFTQLLADFDVDLTQVFSRLSKGYQALVLMALALASQAPYILLDEPFDGLDLFIRERMVKLVIEAVADGQRSVLVASHDLRELDGLADRVLFLKRSRISRDIVLESARQAAVKLQLVFPDNNVPEVVRTVGQVLQVRGRMMEVLFREYTPAIKAEIEAAHPALMDTLPLTLADLFRTEYQDSKGRHRNA